MNEKTLEYIYDEFSNESKNKYDDNIPVDLIEITKRELDELQIHYKTKEYKGKERLFLYDGDEYLFRYIKSFYPNNSKFSFQIANDKMLSEKFLKYSDVRTTNSEIYTEKNYKKAFLKVRNSNTVQVLKPVSLMGGAGVYMNVNERNFDYAWNECVKIQKKKDINNPLVIIQDQISGFEVRINITEGHIFSATLRVPSHVQGDGVNSIENLIKEKNIERKKHPFLRTKLIKIDNNLENILSQKGKYLHEILNKNEFCILLPQSNIASGGENYEITSLLSSGVLNQARDAVLAIPGLHTAGVDLIINDFEEEEGTVIEVNKAPEFLMTYYPIYGKSHNPLNKIFKTLNIESRINRNKLKLDELNEDNLNIIKDRFKFLYDKQQIQEKSLEKLLEENRILKNKINR